jgi:hypothetical protein
MHYVHSNRMLESVSTYAVDAGGEEQPKADYREFRHNFATFTGGLLTGAVLAVAGTMAMYAYERAMEPAPAAPAAVQAQTQETTNDGGFSVGAQVLKADQQN